MHVSSTHVTGMHVALLTVYFDSRWSPLHAYVVISSVCPMQSLISQHSRPDASSCYSWIFMWIMWYICTDAYYVTSFRNPRENISQRNLSSCVKDTEETRISLSKYIILFHHIIIIIFLFHYTLIKSFFINSFFIKLIGSYIYICKKIRFSDILCGTHWKRF